MAVRQRGCSWQADITYKGKRYRSDHGTEELAKRWEEDTRSKLLKGIPLEPVSKAGVETVTMEQLAEVTKTKGRRPWVGSKAEKSTMLNVDDVLGIVGRKLPVSKVTDATVELLLSTLDRRGCSAGTKNRKLAVFSKMMKVAVVKGWCHRMPNIERQPEANGRIRFFTDEEEAAIDNWFRAAGKGETADFVQLLIDTGLRRGEALHLTRADIQADSLTVWESKGGKPRTVPMTERVKNLVQLRLSGGADRLFPSLTPNSVEHHWRQCRTALGRDHDKQWVLHACRHTFCSRLVQAGVPILAVQQLAGHKSVVMTQRYSHLNPGNLADAVNVLNSRSAKATAAGQTSQPQRPPAESGGVYLVVPTDSPPPQVVLSHPPILNIE